MIKLLLLTLLFVLPLFANKVLYLNYQDVPKRVVKGEIFPVTIKTLSTIGMQDSIIYKFSNHRGLKVLNDTPQQEEAGKFILNTFYCLTTSSKAKLPDVRASIADTNYDSTYLRGKRLNVIALNPKADFSNVIASSFDLVEYKTTSFDKSHNILVFVAKAKNSLLKEMKFQNVYKQGVESVTKSFKDARVTYFVIIDKHLENFSFTYFNLQKNKFIQLSIPIIVDDDSVTTQSDLKPKNQSHDRIKAIVVATLALLAIFFLIYKKKYIYIIFVLIPVAYVIYITIPSQEICIKKGTQIHLLPVDNGTIFETTQTRIHLLKEGNVKRYVKVKLQNEKIGWVKNEDICSY